MEWDDYRYLLAVARTGSLSAAAATLGVRHSTVGRRIRGLEERLQGRLFDRVGKRHVLTAAGKDALEAARKIEEEVVAIERSAAGRDRSMSGPLVVATAPAMANTFLMPILEGFVGEHPEVHLRITTSNRMVDLDSRAADVVVRASNNPPPSLIGRRHARLAYAAYAHVDPSESRGWVLRADNSAPQAELVYADRPDDEVALTVDDANAVHAAIRNGVGIGALPCFMGDPDPLLKRVEDIEHTLDLWVLTHRDLRGSSRVKAFQSYISSRLGDVRDLLEGRGEPSPEQSQLRKVRCG